EAAAASSGFSVSASASQNTTTDGPVMRRGALSTLSVESLGSRRPRSARSVAAACCDAGWPPPRQPSVSASARNAYGLIETNIFGLWTLAPTLPPPPPPPPCVVTIGLFVLR